MADLDGITAEQVMDGISRALRERRLDHVVPLMRMLAVLDPEAAQLVLAAVELVRTDRAAAQDVLDVLDGKKTLTIRGSEVRIDG